MIKQFINGSIIKSFNIDQDKVFTTITIDNRNVINPSIDQFLTAGWSEYTEPFEPHIPTLEELVEKKIREKYSINKELQIQRKKDADPEEFQVYYDYVEKCIISAKAQLNNYPYDEN